MILVAEGTAVDFARLAGPGRDPESLASKVLPIQNLAVA